MSLDIYLWNVYSNGKMRNSIIVGYNDGSEMQLKSYEN